MKFFSNNNDINIGSLGEKIAAKFLIRKGYKILDVNFKNDFGKRMGEIDIIAKKDSSIIFIEVKTSTFLESLPEERIDLKKLKKISKISSFYISKKSLWDFECKYDAIAILLDKNGNKYKLKHIKDIFL